MQLDFNKGWWVLIYVILIALLSYFGSYGGGVNKIEFGYDFIILALFSIFIFYLAKLIIASYTKKVHRN